MADKYSKNYYSHPSTKLHEQIGTLLNTGNFANLSSNISSLGLGIVQPGFQFGDHWQAGSGESAY